MASKYASLLLLELGLPICSIPLIGLCGLSRVGGAMLLGVHGSREGGIGIEQVVSPSHDAFWSTLADCSTGEALAKFRGLPGGLLELETVQLNCLERQDSHGRTLSHLSFRLRHWSQANLDRSLSLGFFGIWSGRGGRDPSPDDTLWGCRFCTCFANTSGR